MAKNNPFSLGNVVRATLARKEDSWDSIAADMGLDGSDQSVRSRLSAAFSRARARAESDISTLTGKRKAVAEKIISVPSFRAGRTAEDIYDIS